MRHRPVLHILAQHPAEQPAEIFMTRIRQEASANPSASPQTATAGQVRQAHQSASACPPVGREPPGRPKLQFPRHRPVLEIPDHRGEHIIVRRIHVIQNDFRQLLLLSPGVLDTPTAPAPAENRRWNRMPCRSPAAHQLRVVVADRPEMQLLRPAALVVQPPQNQHQVKSKRLLVRRARRFAGPRRVKNPRRLRLRARPLEHRLQPMVRKPPAQIVEKRVPPVQRRQEIRGTSRTPPSPPASSFPTHALNDCGWSTAKTLSGRNVGYIRVCRTSAGKRHDDAPANPPGRPSCRPPSPEFLQNSLRRQFVRLQFLIGLVPDARAVCSFNSVSMPK